MMPYAAAQQQAAAQHQHQQPVYAPQAYAAPYYPQQQMQQQPYSASALSSSPPSGSPYSVAGEPAAAAAAAQHQQQAHAHAHAQHFAQQQQHQAMMAQSYGHPYAQHNNMAGVPMYAPMVASATNSPPHRQPHLQQQQRPPMAAMAVGPPLPASAAASSAAGSSSSAIAASVPALVSSGSPPPAYAAVAASPAAPKQRRPRPAGSAPSSANRGAGLGSGGPGEPVIESGPGTALGDLPLLVRRFEKVSNEDPRTKFLYTVCFPTAATTAIPERAAKRALRMFNGWGSAESRALASARMQEFLPDSDLLRKVARLFDLSAEGTASAVAERIESYLAAPDLVIPPPKGASSSLAADSGAGAGSSATVVTLDANGAPVVAAAAPKKRRKPAVPKEKHLKRPPNPYQLFATSKREEVTRAQPNLQMMEVNRILGQMWGAVPTEQRAPYVEAAARARADWLRNHPEGVQGTSSAGGAGAKRRKTDLGGYTVDGGGDLDFDDSDLQSEGGGGVGGVGAGADVAVSNGVASFSAPGPALDLEVAATLQLAVARMHLATSTDLEHMTLRTIKQTLAQQFGEKTVEQYQSLITWLVDAELARPA
jgi:hypothetical protein